MLKIFQVDWRIPGGGEPSGPMIIGGEKRQRNDKYGTDIITANSAFMARNVVREARTSVIIIQTIALDCFEA